MFFHQEGPKEGALVCPHDGRRLQVKKSIPNLLPDKHGVLTRQPLVADGCGGSGSCNGGNTKRRQLPPL